MDKVFLIQLTKNLYQLTLLFPKKEPLRYKMRELADEILANCLISPLKQNLSLEDFEILDCGWEMNSKSYFWFYFPKKDLDKVKIHFGPPKSAPEEHIKRFKQKWKSVKLIEDKWAVELKRNFIKPEGLAKLLAKKHKLKWL